MHLGSVPTRTLTTHSRSCVKNGWHCASNLFTVEDVRQPCFQGPEGSQPPSDHRSVHSVLGRVRCGPSTFSRERQQTWWYTIVALSTSQWRTRVPMVTDGSTVSSFHSSSGRRQT